MNKKKIVLLVLGAVLLTLFVAPLAAQKSPKGPFDFPKLNPLKTPPVTQLTMKNGIRLFLIEDHRFPTIDMRGMFFTSSAFEPADKIGLADLTGTVLRTGGTKGRGGDQIDRELETMAASIETAIDNESGSITVSMLKENLNQVLPIMVDILRRPVFDQEKIDLAKIEARSNISRRNDDVSQITDREFTKLIYGAQSPYARHPEYATIDAINRDDIVAFYKGYFHPDNMWLAVWGDFNSRQMIKKIEAAVGDWPASGLKLPALPEVIYDYRPSVNYIEKTDVNQSNIIIGHIGGLLDSPDYAALSVMNRILSFDRMFKKIRTDEGLAYSVWGYYGAGYKVPGVFSAGAQTKSESTVKAIGLVLDEMKRICKEEVSDEELKRAKDQFLNSYVFQFDSRAKIIRRMLTNAFNGYPLDFSEQLIKKIETVTKADVLNAAKKYLRPEQVQILVVGKQADFDKPLSTFDTVNTIDITIPVPKAEQGPVASAESIAQGKTILEKAIQTMGGSDKIKAVKSTSFKGDMVTQGMTMAAEGIIVYPDRIKFTINTPGGQMVMKINGAKGIAQTPQGNFPLPETQVKPMLENILRDPIYVFQNLDKYQVQYLGDKKFADLDTADLLINGPVTCHYFIDKKSFQVIGCQYQGVTQSGPAAMEDAYSDFRSVDGILFSFKTVARADGQVASEMNLKEVKLNVPVSEADFKTE